MRKVYLDGLPKRGKTNQIVWKESIGLKIPFIYEDKEGELLIVDYNLSDYKVSVEYQGEISKIFVGHLKDCKIGSIIGAITKEFRYDINEIVKVRTGNYIIIDKRKLGKKKSYKGYEYKCLECNYIGEAQEHHIVKKQGCPICLNIKVMVGKNDMWTTNPDMAKLLYAKEDGYLYMENSNKSLSWKCPNCKTKINNKRPSTIKRYGLSCPSCSDSVSYPEKIMFNVLNQLDIKFEKGVTFKWSKSKIYDFYIPKYKCIIETHGNQHYEYTFEKLGGRSLEEEKENDDLKKRLAKSNGISHYVTIDCRKSNIDFIKKNILASELNEIMNISVINWRKCHEHACGSIVKTVSELWNGGLHSTVKIGEIVGLKRHAISNYLKRGQKLNWCDYDPTEVQKSNGGKTKSKPVLQFYLNGTYIKEWENATVAAKKLNSSPNNIRNACRGYTQATLGYKWMYKEDYKKYIEENNNSNNEAM